mmetsp:Transcript_725/g.1973  ORF Transcript_725/g.1973 Transcript_725/m.1973 type:complete len:128 (+) Transcript_725:35-418(+)
MTTQAAAAAPPPRRRRLLAAGLALLAVGIFMLAVTSSFDPAAGKKEPLKDCKKEAHAYKKNKLKDCNSNRWTCENHDCHDCVFAAHCPCREDCIANYHVCDDEQDRIFAEMMDRCDLMKPEKAVRSR